ncbi:MAG TPA: hypothetical protein PLL30_16880 [Candidatus Krumholzibacteria bacterium]|nr:hypothetical protein [Candidatus Krumholzibacteria bacterium]HPD73449.1 hypothetical protein [Candidatus Krumholzibacteria bacterium]HRY42171.1 hypothetical protein [Candidatus Krumholzibacteria bacterium]
MPRADGWIRESKYHLKLNGWTICKVIVLGLAQYELWQGKEYIGCFLDADEAKAAFGELNAGEALYQPIF